MPCTLASLDFGPLIELAAYNILGNKSMIEALGLPIVPAEPRCDRFPRRTHPLCKSAVDPCSYRTRTSSPPAERPPASACGEVILDDAPRPVRAAARTADCARRSHGSARLVFPNMRRGSSRGCAPMARIPRRLKDHDRQRPPRSVLLLGLLWRCATCGRGGAAGVRRLRGHHRPPRGVGRRERAVRGRRAAVLKRLLEQRTTKQRRRPRCATSWSPCGSRRERVGGPRRRSQADAREDQPDERRGARPLPRVEGGRGSWVEYRPMTARRRAIVYSSG